MVATFGHRFLATFSSGRFLSRDQSKTGHEEAWALTAAEVAEFDNDGHGGDFLEIFAGHEKR